MVNPKDIIERIESDFGDKAPEVMRIIDQAISKADYLNKDRIIRCILFLSNKDIEKLKVNIQAATTDPRDIMYWAEYINHDQPEKTKRIRDFNKPFSEAEKDKKPINAFKTFHSVFRFEKSNQGNARIQAILSHQ